MAFEEAGGKAAEGPRTGRQKDFFNQTARLQPVDPADEDRPPANRKAARRPVASFDPQFSDAPASDAAPDYPAHERKLILTGNAIKVLEKRYLKKGEDGNPVETPEEMFLRVAENIARAETNYGKSKEEAEAVSRGFYEMMAGLDFLPNSPTLMNAGRELQQLSACFVLPIEDTMESIFSTIKKTALIHQSGGGTGFSFSRLRPANDKVASTGGVASGPVSFMRVFNAATEAVKQGGTRRGANMGILRVDHPDIIEFINCKDSSGEYNNFNISVGITEKFMEAVDKGLDYDLVSPRSGKPVKKLPARMVFGQIVELAWRTGDPGIVFLDRLNRDNPTPHIGEIESTNPCGEQPLLPHESCNLGSINLSNMVDGNSVDWGKLKETVRASVRFLDDVIDMNRYPLPEISDMTRGNRKIGLGIMGFADMLIKLGIPYNSDDAVSLGRSAMKFIDSEAKAASEELAGERGVFPNFDGSAYDSEGGRKMRNATVTTIAPTGTLSIIAGCSSGIEPLFAVSYIRTVMDKDELVEVNPYFAAVAKERGFYSDKLMRKIAHHGTVADIKEVPEDIRRLFVTAHDIAPAWHVKMQAAFQEYTDNAVSKTVNFSHDAKIGDVEEVYRLAYSLGCKGVTIYRDGSKDEQVLTTGRTKEAKEKAQAPPSEKIGREPGKIMPRPRPYITKGYTRQVNTGCGRLYVTINEDEKGLCELFAMMGKSGGCATSQTEATGRLVSLALRSGVDPASIIDQLKGIRCPSPAWVSGSTIYSCADAIATVLEEYLLEKKQDSAQDKSAADDNLLNHCPQCPECGSMVSFAEGCVVCSSCGYSKCG